MDQRLIFSLVLALFVNFQYGVSASPPLRIINGTTADEGEFPYMVQLKTDRGYFTCGGAIIGSEWIITAGHCVTDGDIGSIIYGTNEFYGTGYPNTTIKVKNWFLHPQYIHIVAPIYDIGILQLEESIPFSATAQPIKLGEANEMVPFHVQGVLSGWGVNKTYGSEPPYLQKINLQLLSDEECKQKINDVIGHIAFIAAHHLCSDDYYNGGCSGDSGGPFVINGTAYGLVSWSYDQCGTTPEIYTRIVNPDYRDWIKNVTGI